jgi:hypothetical protein
MFSYSSPQIQIPDEPQPEKEKKTEAIRQFFQKLAGDDMEVDWMELKDILDYAMRNGKTIGRDFRKISVNNNNNNNIEVHFITH